MTDKTHRRAQCVVSKFKISHELVTPAENDTLEGIQAAADAHNSKIAPLMDALKNLGVSVENVGPVIQGRIIEVVEPDAPKPLAKIEGDA